MIGIIRKFFELCLITVALIGIGFGVLGLSILLWFLVCIELILDIPTKIWNTIKKIFTKTA